MRRKLPGRLRIPPPLPAQRRATALLGIIVVLFQAILFTRHHHTHPFPLHGLSAVGAIVVANGDPVLPLADDDCQICLALGHQTATPVDFLAAPLADHEPLPLLSAAAVHRLFPPYLLFRSRAPPLARVRLRRLTDNRGTPRRAP